MRNHWHPLLDGIIIVVVDVMLAIILTPIIVQALMHTQLDIPMVILSTICTPMHICGLLLKMAILPDTIICLITIVQLVITTTQRTTPCPSDASRISFPQPTALL